MFIHIARTKFNIFDAISIIHQRYGLSKYFQDVPNKCNKCFCLPNQEQKRFAGHSKWSNIKFQKMHKDNARAKLFGQLSREIIQAVKESGPDPNYNQKLESLMIKAKSSCMPKDKIETSIKNAMRNSDEKHTSLLFQARGPRKCGLLIDILTPNPLRTKPEIKTILKKNVGIFIEDGSVAFMFDHKGVVTIEDNLSLSKEGFDDAAIEQVEEIAIEIDAEDILCSFEEEQNVFQFLCAPLDVVKLQRQIIKDYPKLNIMSAEVQYLAKTLVNLNEEEVHQSDRLIESITDHPDVLNVYDNIEDYPSKTIKLKSQFDYV